MMATKPKTSKVPAPAIDPVFAAISEHKALTKESNRLEKNCDTARDKAEKRYGEWIEHIRRCRSENRSDDWPGEATVSPFYDRWNRACRAESKAAMRMARTKPATLAGAAAMIAHIQRGVAAASDNVEDWTPTALKTVTSALTRMGREAA
jgi:hypothetical protein